MSSTETRNDLISSEDLSRLDEFGSVLGSIEEARRMPGYIGGLILASNVLPGLMISDLANTVAANKQLRLPVDCENRDEYVGYLSRHAYQVSRQDIAHGNYLKLTDAITGAAMAQGNDRQVSRSLELGKRIVVQRAHLTALCLAQSAKAPQTYIPALDAKTGEVLFDRASKAYGRTDISPLSTTPRVDGRRFQGLMDKICERGSSDIENPLAISNPSRFLFGRIGQRIKRGQMVINLSKMARKPETVDLALEEAFDTFYPKLNSAVSDKEVIFIARFTLKVSRLFDGAARLDPEIAEDPRPKHLSILCNNLTSWDIPKQTAAFEKSVRVAAQSEPNH